MNYGGYMVARFYGGIASGDFHLALSNPCNYNAVSRKLKFSEGNAALLPAVGYRKLVDPCFSAVKGGKKPQISAFDLGLD